MAKKALLKKKAVALRPNGRAAQAARQATVRAERRRAAAVRDNYGGVSSSAVEARTGRSWSEWCKALDAAGARKLDHKAIALLLRDRFHLTGWWAQTVTVGYEQAVLGRKKHQKPDGFEISSSRTVGVDISILYESWANPRLRSRWLAESPHLTVRKATKNKSMRITWTDDSSVSVYFSQKGPARSQVQIQHGKLRSAAAAARAKTGWKSRLNALAAALEGGGD